ncbi:MAG: ABC transporter ATP-binding protein [Terriglobia bacterium]
MATVSLENISKSFGSVEVVRGVSIEVPDRAFVVLVGPSGCGKSTLLRLIAGLEEVTGGIIRIGGTVVNNVLPRDRDIAMVFQNYALYPHMTVYENMAFQMKVRGRPRHEVDGNVRKVAEILGLTPLLKRYPKQLSGGQRQRVAMGRAMVRQPQVFLFDEPLSNIDANVRAQLRAEIRSLQVRLHTTTIYVTHDQLEAMTMGDLIVVLRDGVVEQVGTPLEVFDRPANVFVAGFIGSPSMNLLEGTLRREGGCAWVNTRAGLVRLPCAVDVSDGAKVIYGVRPTAFCLSEDPAAIKARIEAVEPTGDSTQLRVNAREARLVVVFQERRPFERGMQISMLPAQSSIHVFDAESGKRLEFITESLERVR